MTKKPYFSLLRREGRNTPWCIEFGDYERKTVSDEMDEYRDNGETLANLRIIKTADDQASINAKVAGLNAPRGVTFEQFTATRRECAALPETTGPSNQPVPGLLYLSTLYIETRQEWWTDEAKKAGAYYLILENQEWISDDLPALERKLYDFAKVGGFLEA